MTINYVKNSTYHRDNRAGRSLSCRIPFKERVHCHGIKRRSSLINTERIDHLYEDPHSDNKQFILHYGDLTDSTNLIRIIQDVRPMRYTTSAPRAMLW